ncbi:RES family NAD+ phosphorylase [Streptomyces sp. NPDC046931]|uniref:RES family NAD+ phosphorylase n=1 Tax=Streptomyces sp. NPDC046931 TaxID=3154806 RepID=UPI0034015368
MVGQIPPAEATMEPVLTLLPADTLIWRCHRHRYGAAEFNPRTAHEFFKGSRFDSTEKDPYPFLYAALDPVTALAEVLLRSVEFGDRSAIRQIPWAQASAYALSAVRTAEDLVLVDLTSAEALAAVWQDDWLVDCRPDDYPQTRYWVRLIREHSKRAQGLRWTSKRCRPRPALQFFGDRCAGQPLTTRSESSLRLDSDTDVQEVNRMLGPLRAVISTPES